MGSRSESSRERSTDPHTQTSFIPPLLCSVTRKAPANTTCAVAMICTLNCIVMHISCVVITGLKVLQSYLSAQLNIFYEDSFIDQNDKRISVEKPTTKFPSQNL